MRLRVGAAQSNGQTDHPTVSATGPTLAVTSVLGVQVVVHGEPADLETVGDVFHRFAESEGPELVEPSNDILFARPIKTRDRRADLAFDLVDQPVEGTVQSGGPKAADHRSVPGQWDVAASEFCGGHDLAAEGERQRLDRFEKLLHSVKLAD